LVNEREINLQNPSTTAGEISYLISLRARRNSKLNKNKLLRYFEGNDKFNKIKDII